MATLRAAQVQKIRSQWRGNGGDKTLYELKQLYEMTVNEMYCILSTCDFEAMRRANSRHGWKVHSYREVA